MNHPEHKASWAKGRGKAALLSRPAAWVRSRRKTCSTNCPRMKRAMALPCLVIEPSRSVAWPEFRQPGVQAPVVRPDCPVAETDAS